mmetsp:Transcript_6234/g.18806  ORF Transcript_6234/g.18806 Transcript_6234/m.18806 type:complete len:380 (-) Transcript_6234:4087-5226(-)
MRTGSTVVDDCINIEAKVLTRKLRRDVGCRFLLGAMDPVPRERRQMGALGGFRPPHQPSSHVRRQQILHMKGGRGEPILGRVAVCLGASGRCVRRGFHVTIQERLVADLGCPVVGSRALLSAPSDPHEPLRIRRVPCVATPRAGDSIASAPEVVVRAVGCVCVSVLRAVLIVNRIHKIAWLRNRIHLPVGRPGRRIPGLPRHLIQCFQRGRVCFQLRQGFLLLLTLYVCQPVPRAREDLPTRGVAKEVGRRNSIVAARIGLLEGFDGRCNGPRFARLRYRSDQRNSSGTQLTSQLDSLLDKVGGRGEVPATFDHVRQTLSVRPNCFSGLHRVESGPRRGYRGAQLVVDALLLLERFSQHSRLIGLFKQSKVLQSGAQLL